MNTLRYLMGIVLVFCVGCVATPTPTEILPPTPTVAPSPTTASTSTSTPTPTLPITRPTLAANVVVSLTTTLAQFGLSPKDVNVERTTTLALPPDLLSDPDKNKSGVVLMSVPLLTVKTGKNGTPLGVLFTTRGVQNGTVKLLPGPYLVVQSSADLVSMVDSAGKVAAETKFVVRKMERQVNPPETIMTAEDTCQSWDTTQICYPPSIRDALTDKETGTIDALMGKAVTELVTAKKIDPGIESIDIPSALPDVEGLEAFKRQQASFLGAPNVKSLEVREGVLLGVLSVLLPIEAPGQPFINKGNYAVRLLNVGTDKLIARLESSAGEIILMPLKQIEVRGAVVNGKDKPLGIVRHWYWWWDNKRQWCMFE